MMNPEVKKLWVAALREPNRKQVQKQLEIENKGQCCLGVLCEIAAKQGIITRQPISGNVFYGDMYIILPYEVCKWSGMVSSLGDNVTIYEISNPLITHNDYGCTFAEIANAIEEQL